MKSLRSLALLFVLASLAGTSAQDIGCYVSGECLGALFLDQGPSDSPLSCLTSCQQIEGCLFFTYYYEDELCFNFANCDEFSDSGCSDCVSGEADCPAQACFLAGSECQGSIVDYYPDVSSPEECLGYCQSTSGCGWFIYDESDSVCTLTEDCVDVVECAECVIGSVECDGGTTGGTTDGPPGEEMATIMVIGGATDQTSSDDDVEVVTINDPQECAKPASLPVGGQGFVALTNADGLPMVCGGTTALDGQDYRSCLVYANDYNAWIDDGTKMIRERDYAATVLLDDGRYWITGGGDSPSTETTEYYDPSTGDFENGPDLPVPMIQHCAVEVAPGTVFVLYQLNSYLFDVEEEKFTPLKQIPESVYRGVCGVAPSADGSHTNVVVAGNNAGSENVWLYNVDAGIWTPGPPFPVDLCCSSSLPLGDSFLAIGGYRYSTGFELGTIYEYDYLNLNWTLRDEFLALRRQFHSVVEVEQTVLDCQ